MVELSIISLLPGFLSKEVLFCCGVVASFFVWSSIEPKLRWLLSLLSSSACSLFSSASTVLKLGLGFSGEISSVILAKSSLIFTERDSSPSSRLNYLSIISPITCLPLALAEACTGRLSILGALETVTVGT